MGACGKYAYYYSSDSIATDSIAIGTAAAVHIASQANGHRWVVIAADAGFGGSALATVAPVIAGHGEEVVKSFIMLP
jgi:hypothetical protein